MTVSLNIPDKNVFQYIKVIALPRPGDKIIVMSKTYIVGNVVHDIDLGKTYIEVKPQK